MNIRRHGLVLIAFFLFVIAGATNMVEAAAFTIVKDGRPEATIVLPAVTEADVFPANTLKKAEADFRAAHPDAADAEVAAHLKQWQRWIDGELKRAGDEEKTAASELQSIVKKITGAELLIVQLASADASLPEGNVILIGTELATKQGLGDRLAKLHPEGLAIVASQYKLVLAGRDARGALYATYHLLETLGCRWVMPGEFGEIYPDTKTLDTSLDIDENPDHDERLFWCTYGHEPEYKTWTLRQKGDFVKAIGEPTVHAGHGLSGPLKWKEGIEKFGVEIVEPVRERVKTEDGKWAKDAEGKQVWNTEEKPIRRLPDEYYAMHEGKINRMVPNFSNPKVWDYYADAYVDYFQAAPWQQYRSISAEDGFVIDERPASASLRSNEYDFAMGAMTSTDPLWFFHNKVLDRVVKQLPEKKFGVLVYANNMTPPRIEQVHPNMALVFAPLGISPLHHVRDPKSKTNREYHKWFEDWMALAKAAGAETYYYDYEPMGYCWNMAMICSRWGIIGTNYPWFHELGLDGHNTQGYDDWASSGLDNYLMQRLYWDIETSYKDVMADYARARFGKAADTMLAYYQVYEDRMSEIPDLYSNEPWANHLVLTPEVRAKARALVEKALTEADHVQSKAHVQTMVDLQISTDAFCDGVEHMRETGDYAGAVKIMSKVFEVRDKLNAIYPNFMNKVRLDETKTVPFMTGGMYHQYQTIARQIDDADEAIVLPRYWQGGLDTRNRAIPNKWHLPETQMTNADTLDITVCPDVPYQTQREPAAYFYRASFDVPASFEGKNVSIFFPGLIAKTLQIWVNGQPVTFEHEGYADGVWRGPNYFWMNYDHRQQYDLGGLIKPGEKNTIAFRVFKSFDFGGSYRRAWLLADNEKN